MGLCSSKGGTAGAFERGPTGKHGGNNVNKGGGADRSPASSKGGGRDLRYNMLKASKGERFHETYELQQGELGAAAMGCVVRAGRNKRTGEMFAVKTFMVSSVRKKKAQRRILETLRHEIDMLRSLDHPNIVRAYESYEVGQDLHVVMELCRGGDLGARTYTEAQAAAVVRQVLSAILHAHEKGICHRDLKFENILWESEADDAQIKLIDFGMSARFQEGIPMKERVGTVYTMAPEVLQGEYTKQADLWSVGCITFHLIAGQPPFECEEEVDTMRRLLAVKYFWPAGLKVSSEVKTFCYNLLKFDPRRRWTVQEAIVSPWIKRFAPGGRDASSATAAAAAAPRPRNVNGSAYYAYSQIAETTPSTGAPYSTPLAGTAAAAAGAESLGVSSNAARLAAATGLLPTASGGTTSAAGVEAGAGGRPAAGVAENGGSGEGAQRREDGGLQEVPIQVRMLSSMRDYRSYGALRRTALMVVAYNQSPDKLRELRNEFVDFDTEANGKISREEMRAALAQRGVGPAEIEELFQNLDVDRSGYIHYLEFLAATIEAVGATEEVRLRQAFDRLDTDDSGSITLDNLREIMGPSYDDETIRKTLEEADNEKDGLVGWDDFLLLMRDRRGVETLVAQELQAVDELKSAISPDPSACGMTSAAAATTTTAAAAPSTLPTAAANQEEASATASKAEATTAAEAEVGAGAGAAEGGATHGAVATDVGTPTGGEPRIAVPGPPKAQLGEKVGL